MAQKMIDIVREAAITANIAPEECVNAPKRKRSRKTKSLSVVLNVENNCDACAPGASTSQPSSLKDGEIHSDSPASPTLANTGIQVDIGNSDENANAFPWPMKKQRIEKVPKPRKYLIFNQIYTVNWSGTKNVVIGLDIAAKYEPLLNITRYTNGKTVGVYLCRREFANLMSPNVLDFVGRYFQSLDPTYKPKAIDISDQWRIEFRNYCNNKSIVLTETQSSQKKLAGFIADSIILQEPSWNMILRLCPIIEDTFDWLADCQAAAIRATDLIIRDAPLVIITPHEFSTTQNKTVTRTQMANFKVNDLSPIHTDTKLARKILDEIRTFCDDKLLSALMEAKYHSSQPTPKSTITTHTGPTMNTTTTTTTTTAL